MGAHDAVIDSKLNMSPLPVHCLANIAVCPVLTVYWAVLVLLIFGEVNAILCYLKHGESFWQAKVSLRTSSIEFNAYQQTLQNHSEKSRAPEMHMVLEQASSSVNAVSASALKLGRVQVYQVFIVLMSSCI